MKSRFLCLTVISILLISLLPVSAAGAVIVSTDSPEYKEIAGGWNDSSLADGIGGKRTRFTNANGAAAEWRPKLEKGSYTVSIFKVVHETSDSATKVEVFHEGGTETAVLNYQEGSSSWVVLGTFNFNGDGYVRATRGNGIFRAGSVRFTPAGGGITGVSKELFSDISDSSAKSAIMLLTQLGIMDGKEGMLFAPLDHLTRAEVSAIVVRCLGLSETTEKSKTRYLDVPESHWASGYIDRATQYGIVQGMDGYNFEPDSNVTLYQLLKMMVKLLGYDYKAIQAGYPLGYLTTASEIGLLRGIQNMGDEEITREMTARILNNALTIDMMQLTGAAGVNARYTSYRGENILTKNLNLIKDEGIISANYLTALNGRSNLKAGEVMLNGSVYKDPGGNAAGMLGYYVTAYVTDENKTGKPSEIAVVVGNHSKNTVISVDARDVLDATTVSSLKYDDSGTKSASISPSADLIYNGIAKFAWSRKDLMPANGSITLIDNTGDSLYDIIYVREFVNLVVKSVNRTDLIVSFKYPWQDEPQTLTFDRADNGIKSIVMEASGEPSDIAGLNEWDVISAAVDETQTLIEAYIGRMKVSGQISEVANAEERAIRVNDRFYTVAYNVEKQIERGEIKDFTPGDSAEFTLDYQNKIAAVNYEGVATKAYAYLINAQTLTGIETGAEFRIFSDNGMMSDLQAANKVTVNGNRMNAGSSDFAAFITSLNGGGSGFTRQIITYEVNSEGKIIEINTPSDGYGPDKLNLVYEGALYYRASPRMFGAKYLINESTKIFFVPVAEQAGLYNQYSVRTPAAFRNDTEYTVKLYDLNKNQRLGAVVYEGRLGIDSRSSMGIVDRVAQGIDGDGNIVSLVSIYSGGQSRRFSVDPEFTAVDASAVLNPTIGIPVDVSTLKNGDILQYDMEGSEITDARLLLRAGDRVFYERHGRSGTAVAAEHSYSHELYYAYGIVQDIITDGILFATINDWQRSLIFNAAVQCYLVDTSRNSICVITPDEIMIDDTVFVQSSVHTVRQIVVYR